jgi:hypothetical protein
LKITPMSTSANPTNIDTTAALNSIDSKGMTPSC